MESTISTKIATIGADGIKSNQLEALWHYFFGNPGPSGIFGVIGLGFIVVFVTAVSLLALISVWRSKKLTPPQKKFFEKLGWYLLPVGLVGVVLLIIKFFGVPWVSIRFLWVIWLAVLVFLGRNLFKYYQEKLPAQQGQYESYLVKKRYLPSKKKSKRH